MIVADDAGKVGFGLFQTTPTDGETISYNDDGVHLKQWARSYTLHAQPLVYTTCLSGSLSTSTAGGNADNPGAIQESGAVSATNGKVRIGVNHNGTAHAKLEVYEIIIFKRGLNIGERMNIVAYLSDKYRLSTN
jgi:hypothetical protein